MFYYWKSKLNGMYSRDQFAEVQIVKAAADMHKDIGSLSGMVRHLMEGDPMTEFQLNWNPLLTNDN